MTELDGVLPQTAFELIEEFGKSVTLTRVFEGAYDTATSQVLAPVPVPYTIKVTPPEPFKGNEIISGLINAGDLKFLLSPLALEVEGAPADYEPGTLDKLDVDGVRHSVANVRKIYSGELVALYEVAARR